jgi:hypothetical protein
VLTRCLLAPLLLWVLVPSARANPVTYDFTAKISLAVSLPFTEGGPLLSVPPELADLAHLIGTEMIGSLTYDDAAPDTQPDDPTWGNYPAILAMSLDFNGLHLAYPPAGPETYLDEEANVYERGAEDVISFGAPIDSRLVSPVLAEDSLVLYLSNVPVLDVLTSDGLGTDLRVIPPQLWTASMDLFDRANTGRVQVSGSLTSLTRREVAAPEPALRGLLALGAALLAARGARARAASRSAGRRCSPRAG